MGDFGSMLPPPTAPSPDWAPEEKPQRKSWWKKWWVITIGVLVALFVMVGIFADSDESDPGTTATATTVDTNTSATTARSADTEPPTETEVPSTTVLATTTEATTTTTEPPPPPPIVLEGNGDQVIPIGQTITEPQILVASNDGTSNFIVDGLNADLEELDLLVNEIGPVVSRNLVDGDQAISFLDISADGPWRLEFVQLDLAIDTSVIASWDGLAPFVSNGNDVLLYTGAAGILQYSNTGDSNFIIYGYPGADLLVNDIGPIEGSGRITPGPLLLEVEADGDWTLAVNPV